MLQVRQLQAEVWRIEEDASILNKDIHASQSAVTKSTVKQQALQLQRSIQQLDLERAQALNEQQQLADPQSSMDALQVRMKRDVSSLEALKSQVKELQIAVKDREGLVAGLRASSATSGYGAAAQLSFFVSHATVWCCSRL
jgi:uncharacterized protein HemX